METLDLLLSKTTQEEVEELFSKDKLQERLNINLSTIIEQINNEYPDYFETIDNILGYNSDNFMLRFLAVLGNKNVGTYIEAIDVRHITIQQMFVTIVKYIDAEPQEQHRIVKAILEASEGVLFDVITKQQQDEYGQWYTLKVLEIAFSDDTDSAELVELSMFKPPIKAGQVLSWKIGSGYRTTDDKCTLNRGEANQPEEVLDVLDKLQSNTWEIHSYVNANRERNYLMDKFSKKGDEEGVATLKAKHATLTSDVVYDYLREGTQQGFHFQYRYDFRGRIYATGYQVTTQGDKWKKGSLKPKFN